MIFFFRNMKCTLRHSISNVFYCDKWYDENGNVTLYNSVTVTTLYSAALMSSTVYQALSIDKFQVRQQLLQFKATQATQPPLTDPIMMVAMQTLKLDSPTKAESMTNWGIHQKANMISKLSSMKAIPENYWSHRMF